MSAAYRRECLWSRVPADGHYRLVGGLKTDISELRGDAAGPQSAPARVGDAVLSFGAADSSFLPVDTAWAAWLDDWLSYQQNFGAGTDERIRAAHLMTFYAHHLACVAAGLFLTDGVVPDLSPKNLFVRFEPFDRRSGRPEAARRFHFRSPHLPTRVGADDLHDRFVESLMPAVEALNLRCQLSTGSLWRLASDGIFGAFLDGGTGSAEDETAMAAGLAIVEREGSPFCSGLPRVERVAGTDGRERLHRIRSGCCLAYRAEGGRHCDVCVLLPADERRRRLSALGLGAALV